MTYHVSAHVYPFLAPASHCLEALTYYVYALCFCTRQNARETIAWPMISGAMILPCVIIQIESQLSNSRKSTRVVRPLHDGPAADRVVRLRGRCADPSHHQEQHDWLQERELQPCKKNFVAQVKVKRQPGLTRATRGTAYPRLPRGRIAALTRWRSSSSAGPDTCHSVPARILAKIRGHTCRRV